ncbi:DUF1272 domain-containing protein [Microbulbifer salipaludis]|uniref:DUF1272 domain-containing protein n=1 Tax=Microbulbifer salipaludis TaxID=187980 RepID=A0ABS3EAJ9_9GAMM|nr:DUF1272 domain-containing protein [Microbulbifer salipaludis]MBN8432089.1 DUF1272 domain-containing protein [Microbulbifer salipaludis]
MLKMKATCERCSAQLGLADEAFICSYECTFCPECTEALRRQCPNCQGNLVLRPLRRSSPTAVAKSGFKAKLETILP